MRGHARSEIPSYDLVVPALLEKGVAHLQEACQLTPGPSSSPSLDPSSHSRPR